MMERAMPAIYKFAHRHAAQDGPVVTWLLHGFTFTVDEEGVWRLRGEEAMAQLFAMASKVEAGKGKGVVRVAATEEFMDACRGAEDLKVSSELETAGLKC